jgi:hypothetical protein
MPGRAVVARPSRDRPSGRQSGFLEPPKGRSNRAFAKRRNRLSGGLKNHQKIPFIQ